MKNIPFIRESIRNLKTVGTITKSSRALCKGAANEVDYTAAKEIVELGAGDGVITKHILKAMAPDARLMVFEVNESFCDQLRAIDDDRLIVIQDGAEQLDHYLTEHHFVGLDAVISAIPFVIFSDEQARQIITDCRNHLKSGGLYVQVHYSLVARKMYRDIFGNVKTKFIPLNIPPAFVLTSQVNGKKV
ncbi:MAG: methyltransferase domain-containing protein [Bacteroidetes bacterium]|jgi:phospholipid N-methyltransferase|nr:methyltransferase domain-containing protein [Bacteroidota bacterium]